MGVLFLMWFVYLDEMTLKYLTLSSFFRFLFCFVLRIFFGPTLESSCFKIQWISAHLQFI